MFYLCQIFALDSVIKTQRCLARMEALNVPFDFSKSSIWCCVLPSQYLYKGISFHVLLIHTQASH